MRALRRWSRGQISPVATGGDGLGWRRDSPAWRSRRRSAPNRGKAAARVVGLCCGIGWTQEVRGDLKKALGILGRRAHHDCNTVI